MFIKRPLKYWKSNPQRIFIYIRIIFIQDVYNIHFWQRIFTQNLTPYKWGNLNSQWTYEEGFNFISHQGYTNWNNSWDAITHPPEWWKGKGRGGVGLGEEEEFLNERVEKRKKIPSIGVDVEQPELLYPTGGSRYWKIYTVNTGSITPLEALAVSTEAEHMYTLWPRYFTFRYIPNRDS